MEKVFDMGANLKDIEFIGLGLPRMGFAKGFLDTREGIDREIARAFDFKVDPSFSRSRTAIVLRGAGGDTFTMINVGRGDEG